SRRRAEANTRVFLRRGSRGRQRSVAGRRLHVQRQGVPAAVRAGEHEVVDLGQREELLSALTSARWEAGAVARVVTAPASPAPPTGNSARVNFGVRPAPLPLACARGRRSPDALASRSLRPCPRSVR